MRIIRLLIKPLVVALILGALFGAHDPAAAFPRPAFPLHCGPNVTWRFDGSNWGASEKTAVRDGFDDWELALDYDGSRLVDLTEVSSSAEILVKKVDDPGGGGLGEASCFFGFIELKSTLSDTDMKAVGRHEMGHIVGGSHTGDDDSFGGPVEAMATCLTATQRSQQGMSQDDYGMVMHKDTSLSPEAIHANASFEQGTSWWGTSNAASFSTTTADASDGTTSARFRGNATSSYVYQTMNYAASSGLSVDARTNIRKLAGTDTGSMSMNILKKGVTYGPEGTCDYPTNKDQNNRTAVDSSWVVVRVETCTPTTSWATCTEATTYTIPSRDAHDLRIAVYSSVKTSGGALATVGIDFARIRDRS